MPRHPNLEIERELRRIGVDVEGPSGLAVTGEQIEPDQFLHWLRTLPTGTGVAEYERAVTSGRFVAEV